jgi:hypothetical protein
MKENLELFVLNQTKFDVSISDLGVKVPASKSINIYKANPYLTPEQVERSKTTGALYRRLSGENPVLKVVKRVSVLNTSVIAKLKESTEPVKIKKTKSSIVIEMPDEPEQEQISLDFADYGIIDEQNTNRIRDQNSVFVKAKEDLIEKQKPIVEIKTKSVANTLNNQSTIIMEVEPEKFEKIEEIVANEPKTMTFAASKQKTELAQEIILDEGTIKIAAKKDHKNKKVKFNTIRRSDGELLDDPSVLEDIKLEETQNPAKVNDAVIVESKQKTEK